MKARLPNMTTVTHSKLYREDGRLNVVTSPRCKSIYSDGKQCKNPAIRLNKCEKPEIYTNHCYKHGGKQEREAHRRALVRASVESGQAKVTGQLADILNVSTRADSLHPTTPTTASNTEGLTADNLHASTDEQAMVPSTLPAEKLARETKPESHGRVYLHNLTPQSPSNQSPSNQLNLSPGGGSEILPSRNFGSKENGENMYTIPNTTLRKSFERKLKGSLNLNEELALTRALIQQILTSLDTPNPSAEVLGKLDKLMSRADKILNTIHKIESTRKVQYTRESLRLEVMKVVGIIRKLVPEEDRRRTMATELARVLGPTLAESGDIIVTKETFRRG